MNEREYLKSQNYKTLKESVLTKLDAIRTTKRMNPMSYVASEWMKSLVNDFYNVPVANKRENLVRAGGITLAKTQLKRPGEMFFFHYKPTTSNEYWDAFPLIFITKVTKNGFYGINLHYLPPKYREFLFMGLSRLTVPNSPDRFTVEDSDRYKLARLRLTYDILKSARRYRFFKPCYRKYKYTGIVGNMLLIEPKYWDIALYLPLASFNGISKQDLYRRSKKNLRKLDGR